MKLLVHPTVRNEAVNAFRSAGHDVLVDAQPDFPRQVRKAVELDRLLVAPSERLPEAPQVAKDGVGILFLEEACASPRAISRLVLPLMAASHSRRLEHTITLVSDSVSGRVTYFEYEKGQQVARIVVPAGCEETLFYPQIEGRGDLSFIGVQQAGISHVNPFYEVQRTHAPYHLLTLVLSGTLRVSSPQENQTVKSGEMTFIPAGTPFHYRPDCRSNLLWFHLKPEHFKEFPASTGPRMGTSPSPDIFHAYANQYNKEACGIAVDSDSALVPLANLLGQMIRRHLTLLGLAAETMPDEQRRLNKAMQALHENIDRPWGVEELARIAGCSVAHFHRLTQKLLNKSPGRLIREAHMQQACELLASTDDKLESIAELVGYTDGFTFARAFKKHVGVSPGRYRDSRRKNA